MRGLEQGILAPGRVAQKDVEAVDGRIIRNLQNRYQRFGSRNLRAGALDIEVARQPAAQLRLCEFERPLLRREILLGQNDLSLEIAHVEIISRDFGEQSDSHGLGAGLFGL